jgi:hypothetical protein
MMSQCTGDGPSCGSRPTTPPRSRSWRQRWHSRCRWRGVACRWRPSLVIRYPNGLFIHTDAHPPLRRELRRVMSIRAGLVSLRLQRPGPAGGPDPRARRGGVPLEQTGAADVAASNPLRLSADLLHDRALGGAAGAERVAAVLRRLQPSSAIVASHEVSDAAVGEPT